MLKVVISGKNKLVIRMAGKINEACDLNMVFIPFSAEAVEVDLIDVTFINSVGLRLFRDWIMSLKVSVLTFSYCPRVFIEQVNMIQDLIPKHARISSFYVPFYSEASGEEKSVLLTRDQHFVIEDGDIKAMLPGVTDSAGRPMEIDVIPERYFQFLKTY